MKTTIILILSVFLFLGCSKDEPIPEPEPDLINCYHCWVQGHNESRHFDYCNTQDWIDDFAKSWEVRGYYVECWIVN